MQTGLEELIEKTQRQSAEAEVQVKEATGAVSEALRVAELSSMPVPNRAFRRGREPGRGSIHSSRSRVRLAEAKIFSRMGESIRHLRIRGGFEKRTGIVSKNHWRTLENVRICTTGLASHG